MTHDLNESRGVTRVEVLLSVICVVLLGILAALVVPREVVVIQTEGPMTDFGKMMGVMMEDVFERQGLILDELPAWQPPTAEEAMESALLSNLATIRQSIHMYAIQHEDTFPTDLVRQLTTKTDIRGAPGDVYGLYLRRGFPVNPINDSREIRVVDESPPAAVGNAGWIYVQTTGEFRANLPGRDSSGEAFLDL